MKQRINIVSLGVRDLDRAVKFYTDMGWKKSSASEGNIVFFQLGGLVMGLYPKHLFEEDTTVPFNKDGYSPFSLAYVTQNEKEVDEVLALAVKNGAKLLKPAQKVFWGGYSGYFADPDGFLWEVAHAPFFEFDENLNLKMS
jgi:catechol 2,3-dioxygenase-like lactoylglutathione lyase family enzyme